MLRVAIKIRLFVTQKVTFKHDAVSTPIKLLEGVATSYRRLIVVEKTSAYRVVRFLERHMPLVLILLI